MGFLDTILNKFRSAPVDRYEGASNSIRRSFLDTSYTSVRFDVTRAPGSRSSESPGSSSRTTR